MGIKRGSTGNAKEISWNYLKHRRPPVGGETDFQPRMGILRDRSILPSTFLSTIVSKGRQASQEGGSFSLVGKKRQLPQEPKFDTRLIDNQSCVIQSPPLA